MSKLLDTSRYFVSNKVLCGLWCEGKGWCWIFGLWFFSLLSPLPFMWLTSVSFALSSEYRIKTDLFSKFGWMCATRVQIEMDENYPWYCCSVTLEPILIISLYGKLWNFNFITLHNVRKDLQDVRGVLQSKAYTFYPSRFWTWEF